jgi:hypothetical protein
MWGKWDNPKVWASLENGTGIRAIYQEDIDFSGVREKVVDWVLARRHGKSALSTTEEPSGLLGKNLKVARSYRLSSLKNLPRVIP